MPIVEVLVLVSSLVAFLTIRDYQRRRGLPYPPGPRPLPLIGNLFDIPKEFSWLTFTRFSKKYGDIISFRVFDQTIVVLNSVKVARDLIERRPDIYSDRPVLPIFQMMGWEWNVALGNCTEEWRVVRKVLDRNLRPASIVTYHPVLEAKAHALLSQVLANPKELEAHVYRLSGSIVLTVGYGYEAKDTNDRIVKVARDLLQLMADVATPGTLLVNVLPFLQHIPEWVPWFSYKPLASLGYDIGQEALHGPMEFAKKSILDCTAQPSLALENLQEAEKLEKSEREKAEEVSTKALGAMYLGGTETTAASLMPFFIAILLRPEIQTMAQKELDAVTMRERLPTFEDRPRLPLIDAICKEVRRWKPAIPLGLFHATASDDIYEGYFIPKSAVVLVNAWAIFHDPVRYPEPDSFKPERFINADGSVREDPVLSILFGLGKRICPGRHLVDSEFFLVIACFLSVFDIKGDGTDGGPDKYPFKGCSITVPCPFTCSITARDRRAEELINASAEAQRAA